MTFKVDPVTGYIITNNTVDFEKTSKFKMLQWIEFFLKPALTEQVFFFKIEVEPENLVKLNCHLA